MEYEYTTTTGLSGTISKQNLIFCYQVLTTLLFATLGLVLYKFYPDSNSNNQNDNENENDNDWTDVSDDNEENITQQTELEFSTPSNLDLSARMKYYEEYCEENIYKIDSEYPFIIRIDGRCFSRLLKSIKKKEFTSTKAPLSYEFKKAMDLTTKDLVKEFNVSCGYNHSDEISLVFKPLLQESKDDTTIREHIFAGRVQKLISVIPAYASVRLSYHLNTINYEKFKDISSLVSFDGRCLIFPSNFEVINYFVWRAKYDCFRNFVSELTYNHFPKKTLTNITTNERINKLQNEGIDVYDYNHTLLYGTYIKRKLVKYVDTDKEYTRNKFVSFTMPDIKCNFDYVDILYNQTLDLDDFPECEFELVSEL